jgi:hypothetical protein
MDAHDHIRIVTDRITRKDIEALSALRFGDMVKVVVDVRRRIAAFGGELHSDEEAVLLGDGSAQEDLWGINVYHAMPREERYEFDSMINIRPSRGNRTRTVEDPTVRALIEEVMNGMIVE